MNYYHLLGIKRSGNHAFMNWIIANHGGKGAFYNDINPNKDKIEYESKNLPCFTEYSEKCNLNQNPNFCAVTMEDETLPVKGVKQYRYLDFCKEEYKQVDSFNILILRDYYNVAASTYQSNLNGRKFVKDFINYNSAFKDLWVQYAKFYLRNNGFIGVLYDKWVKSKEYRNKISIQLNFANRELGLDQFPAYGFGSSFNKEEGFNSRWEVFMDNPRFCESIRDPIVEKYYLEIFGETEQYKYYAINSN